MQQKCIDTVLEYYPTVQAIYLFGSWGTEYQRQDSDIDLALLLPLDAAKAESGRLALSPCSSALSDLVSAEVDLVNLRFVSTVFQHEIIFSGQRIHTGDEWAMNEFEMLTMSYYQTLNEERREILEEFYRTGRAYPV